MKYKHKDMEGSKRLFEIEVSSKILKEKYEEVLNHIKKIAHIPGYRKGNAPRDLLEKSHGQKIKDETIQELVSHSYRHALSESKTDAIGMPEISDLDFNLDKGLFFKLTVYMNPKVSIKRYKGLAVKKQKAEVKPEDVDKYLSILQESNATFKDVHERPVKMGDYVVCDMECLVDEKAIYPKRQGVWVVIEKKNPVSGLIEGLINHKAGEMVEIKTTLPQDFQDEKYRNKAALFKVNLREIKEKHPSELNDEFAKKIGQYNNVEELKKAINLDLARNLEARVRQDMEHQILSQLLKETKFSVPANLVKAETNRLIELRKKELSQKMPKEDIKSDDESLQAAAKKEAMERVKLYFILAEIAEQEALSVEPQEVAQVIASLAAQYKKTKDEVMKYYKENNLIKSLKDQLRQNKVIGFLIDNANIK